MEIRPNSPIQKMAEQLESENERLSMFRENLPSTEYQSIEVTERMEVAKKVLSEFASVGRMRRTPFTPPDNSLKARIAVEDSAYVLRGNVAYTPGEWRNEMSGSYVQRHPTIMVWGSLVDSAAKIETGSTYLGEVIFTPGHTVGRLSDMKDRPIDHPDLLEILEIVDTITSELVDNLPDRHRHTGKLSLQ